MPYYKMILRDGDNPATSALHVTAQYCEASSRSEASKIFESNFGTKYVVAGPAKVEDDQLPEGTVLVTLNA